MNTWWPVDRFATNKMAGSSVKEIRVEPKEGGDIIEVGTCGTEYRWGTIKVYDPYSGLTMDFHINHPDFEEGPMTLVEVKFVVMDDQRTLVELTQSNWDGFGDMAAGVHEGYTIGWGMIFEQAYKAACEA